MTFSDDILRILAESAAQTFDVDLAQIDLSRSKVERPAQLQHGDFACNFAMTQAKTLRNAPRKIAEAVTPTLLEHPWVAHAEIAGPGFINMRLSPEGWRSLLERLDQEAACHWQQSSQAGAKVLVEFVSANPTGPLHVGHGRGAAVGDSLARVLKKCGYDVHTEYYVNDAGLQIQTLGRSVLIRAMQQQGQTVDLPEDCYQGEYVQILARQWDGAPNPIDPEDSEQILAAGSYAAEQVRQGIEQDLSDFGVTFDQWFSERSLHPDGIDQAVARLEQSGHTYIDEGALWLRTTDFGDTKDRVVRRSNDVYTYFAADIAYHLNKIERGYKHMINIWGADHHGYIPRVQAALQILGDEHARLQVALIQFVALLRDGEPVQMSTRSGSFETLKDLIDEVGTDATRFFYLLRKSDTHLDFDLQLATEQSNQNPVYYVQYAHARCCAIERKYKGTAAVPDYFGTQSHESEHQLVHKLMEYRTVLDQAAEQLAPHLVAFYVQDVAAAFHKFYSHCPVANAEPDIQPGRAFLVRLTKLVLADALTQVLGVKAPEEM